MYLKLSDNLFLGKQELNHLKLALDDYGFRKFFGLSVTNYGVVQNAIGSFTNFQTQIGTNPNSLKVLAGYAIDKNTQLITFPTTDNIPIPADSNWYWIKIAFAYSTLEPGTFSIDSSGNLTGSSSTLTSALRGKPNVPSRIKFPNSALNTGEYDVNTVISDTSAVLSGTFVNESNLTLAVVGSFTPDAVPAAGDKLIFQYDGCTMTLVLETVLNTPPTLVSNVEFVIARVQNTGAGYNIQDKRSSNLFVGNSAGAGIFLPLAGGTMSGTLDMGSNRIINLPAAIATGQALRYEQLIGVYLLLAGGTMTGAIDMGSHKITNLTAGSSAADAVRFDQLPVVGAWTNLTLAGTWAAVGTPVPQYRILNGVVELRGEVSGGGAATIVGATPAIAPIASGTRWIPICDMSGGGVIALEIHTDGSLVLNSFTGGHAYSLEGVRYSNA